MRRVWFGVDVWGWRRRPNQSPRVPSSTTSPVPRTVYGSPDLRVFIFSTRDKSRPDRHLSSRTLEYTQKRDGVRSTSRIFGPLFFVGPEIPGLLTLFAQSLKYTSFVVGTDRRSLTTVCVTAPPLPFYDDPVYSVKLWCTDDDPVYSAKLWCTEEGLSRL